MTQATHAIDLVRKGEVELETFLPSSSISGDISAKHFVSFACNQLQGLARNTKDFRPIPASAVTALVTFAMAGLLPNAALGHGYLVPFRTRAGWHVITPVIGYRGLALLARRADTATRKIRAIRMNTICEGDHYDDSLDIEEMVRRHRPATTRSNEDYGKLLYAYSLIRIADLLGGVVSEYHVAELLPQGQIDKVRKQSASSGNKEGPWAKHPLAMAAKTALRRQLTSGAVPIAPLAGMALAAEGAAEARRFGKVRQALQSAQPQLSGWADDASHEMQEWNDAPIGDAYEATAPPEAIAQHPPLDRPDKQTQVFHNALRAADTETALRQILIAINSEVDDGPEKQALFAHYKDRREEVSGE